MIHLMMLGDIRDAMATYQGITHRMLSNSLKSSCHENNRREPTPPCERAVNIPACSSLEKWLNPARTNFGVVEACSNVVISTVPRVRHSCRCVLLRVLPKCSHCVCVDRYQHGLSCTKLISSTRTLFMIFGSIWWNIESLLHPICQ